MSVVDLRELVESYAYRFFKENEKEYHRKLGKNLGWKEMAKEIDWKDLIVKNEKVKQEIFEHDSEPKSNILFSSTFMNETDQEQEYDLNAERKTSKSCNIEITDGFSTESSIELSVKIPLTYLDLEAKTGHKETCNIEHKRSQNISEDLTWSVKSSIKVPKMSRTTAQLIVEENEYKSKFEIKTYFSGAIRLKLFKEGHELLQMDLNDIEDIFTRDKGFKKDNHGLYRITQGECKANYGVQQRIHVIQSDL